jgi:hypothetical protein
VNTSSGSSQVATTAFLFYTKPYLIIFRERIYYLQTEETMIEQTADQSWLFTKLARSVLLSLAVLGPTIRGLGYSSETMAKAWMGLFVATLVLGLGLFVNYLFQYVGEKRRQEEELERLEQIKREADEKTRAARMLAAEEAGIEMAKIRARFVPRFPKRIEPTLQTIVYRDSDDHGPRDNTPSVTAYTEATGQMTVSNWNPYRVGYDSDN